MKDVENTRVPSVEKMSKHLHAGPSIPSAPVQTKAKKRKTASNLPKNASEVATNSQPLVRSKKGKKADVNPSGLKEAFAAAFASSTFNATRDAFSIDNLEMEDYVAQAPGDLEVAGISAIEVSDHEECYVPIPANSPRRSQNSSSTPVNSVGMPIVERISPTPVDPSPPVREAPPSSSIHTLVAGMNIKLPTSFDFNFSDVDEDVDDDSQSLEDISPSPPVVDTSAVALAKKIVMETLRSPYLPTSSEVDSFLTALRFLKKSVDSHSLTFESLHFFHEETPKLVAQNEEADRKLAVSSRLLNDVMSQEQLLTKEKIELKEQGVLRSRDQARADEVRRSIVEMEFQLEKLKDELKNFEFLNAAKAKYVADCMSWATKNRALKKKLKTDVPQMEHNKREAEVEKASIQDTWTCYIRDHVINL